MTSSIAVFFVSYCWACNAPSGENQSGSFFKTLDEAEKFYNDPAGSNYWGQDIVKLECDEEGILQKMTLLRTIRGVKTPSDIDYPLFLCCDGGGTGGSVAELGKKLNCAERPDGLNDEEYDDTPEEFIHEGRYYCHPVQV